MLKNLRDALARLSLPAVLLTVGVAHLALRPSWPVVVGLAVLAAVYVATDLLRSVGMVAELRDLHAKLVKIANRFPS